MTIRQKGILALILFAIGFFGIPSIVLNFRLPDWIAVTFMVVAVCSFMFWGLMFCCPRCGSPLLWDIKNRKFSNRLIPEKSCRTCGLSNSEVYERKSPKLSNRAEDER